MCYIESKLYCMDWLALIEIVFAICIKWGCYADHGIESKSLQMNMVEFKLGLTEFKLYQIESKRGHIKHHQIESILYQIN